MKLIKLFLASSEEMDYDRMVFGNLVRRLNDLYERRGVRLKLFEWEDYDSAFNDQRKQDEYNERVRESDVFLALFHKKAGAFTVEEFDVATETFREKASPKVYTFLKDLKPGEEASPELEEFKRRLFEEMGHYWCRYDNRDSLQFQFVMQLQLVENNMGESLTVDDGVVRIDGIKVASMDQLKFAAGNEDYVKTSEELAALPAKIEKARLRAEKFPDDEDLAEDLQQKLDRYNKLKEEFADYQKILFETAKRVARLQGERITDRMRRAMDAFNDGKVREANIILDEAEADATRNLEDFKQSREITEQKRQTVICSLEELLLKASTMMADASIPIEERIDQVDKIYAQADEMAREIGYEKDKYGRLLSLYARFLFDYALYDRAMVVYQRAISAFEGGKGDSSLTVGNLYHELAGVCLLKGDYSRAEEYYLKVVQMRQELLGEEHPDLASTYNDLGVLSSKRQNYEQAKEYYFKALSIRLKHLGENHPDTAESYCNLGVLYSTLDKDQLAMEYFEKAITVRERTLGENHPDTALAYHNLAHQYEKMEDFPRAKQFFEKALQIRLRLLGENHPDTANSYNALGLLYADLEKEEEALAYYRRALIIRLRTLGEEHQDVAVSYSNIASVFYGMGDHDEALAYFQKAYSIESRLGMVTHVLLNNIAFLYEEEKNYAEALDYYKKALTAARRVYGDDHLETAILEECVGSTYRTLGDHQNALAYLTKAQVAYEKLFGSDDSRTEEVRAMAEEERRLILS